MHILDDLISEKWAILFGHMRVAVASLRVMVNVIQIDKTNRFTKTINATNIFCKKEHHDQLCKFDQRKFQKLITPFLELIISDSVSNIPLDASAKVTNGRGVVNRPAPNQARETESRY